jgi:hypothetical protein
MRFTDRFVPGNVKRPPRLAWFVMGRKIAASSQQTSK